MLMLWLIGLRQRRGCSLPLFTTHVTYMYMYSVRSSPLSPPDDLASESEPIHLPYHRKMTSNVGLYIFPVSYIHVEPCFLLSSPKLISLVDASLNLIFFPQQLFQSQHSLFI